MASERIPPPRWLKPMNKIFIAMLRLGLPMSRKESPVVLTVPGRRSGKPRSTPVTPMHVDGRRYVVNGYPGADWVRNVRADPNVQVGRTRYVATEVPVANRAPILAVYRPLAGKVVEGYWQQLPDDADHPVFALRPAT